jgi:hypothetical protein
MNAEIAETAEKKFVNRLCGLSVFSVPTSLVR